MFEERGSEIVKFSRVKIRFFFSIRYFSDVEKEGCIDVKYIIEYGIICEISYLNCEICLYMFCDSKNFNFFFY